MQAHDPGSVIVAMLHAVDRLDWPKVRRSFADRVTIDYQSLNGEAPADVNADDLIAGWQGVLPGFDATQHITGPMVLSEEKQDIVAETHVRAYHRIAAADGGEIWIVVGHYTVRLVEQAAAWRITAFKLSVFYQEGNLSLPALAKKRAASAPPRSRW
jgi:hypothetical protein